MPEISTKPYLIRAIHEWCADCGYTPYLAVAVDERTVVPRAYVKNGEIVLNVSMAATHRLAIGNELIEFQARFGGVAHDLSIPVENVTAIYARETGHGMAFDVPKAFALPPQGAPGAGQGAERDRGADRPGDRGGAPRKSRPTAVPPAPRPVEGEASAAPVVVRGPQAGGPEAGTEAVPAGGDANLADPPKLLPPPTVAPHGDSAVPGGAQAASTDAGPLTTDAGPLPADAAIETTQETTQGAPSESSPAGPAPVEGAERPGPDDGGSRPRRRGRPNLTRVK